MALPSIARDAFTSLITDDKMPKIEGQGGVSPFLRSNPTDRSGRPAEWNKLADPTITQVQAAPRKNADDQWNRRTGRVRAAHMTGHRAAKIAGQHDGGE